MSSHLLIDAGATKTAFTLLTEGAVTLQHVDRGINPNYCTETDILQVFAGFVAICPRETAIAAIDYYGAGCMAPRNAALMGELISRFFPNASIQVYSDLMAVCHALSRNQRSIVAILGTGAASCLFDGTSIVRSAPSLGYMLGDEGGGTFLGKQLLTAYLRGTLPAELASDLERSHELSRDKVIHRLYREPEPNRMMASLAPFVQQHLGHPFMHGLALEAFRTFFATQKSCFQGEDLPWQLSGSVAYHFQDVVREAAVMEECRVGDIVDAPMDKLIDYYKKLS
ncbi:MAG: hypothetical protein IKQ20_08725 [Bacteroidales bacterium]|nr:hypothetical protein [Bacteroidales bacterium]